MCNPKLVIHHVAIFRTFSRLQYVEIPTFQEITVEQEIPEVGLQVEKTYSINQKDSWGKIP